MLGAQSGDLPVVIFREGGELSAGLGLRGGERFFVAALGGGEMGRVGDASLLEFGLQGGTLGGEGLSFLVELEGLGGAFLLGRTQVFAVLGGDRVRLPGEIRTEGGDGFLVLVRGGGEVRLVGFAQGLELCEETGRGEESLVAFAD